jgi:hypothetical protein
VRAVNLESIDLPADDKLATRLRWAGERAWDIAEGLLSREGSWYVWNVVVGWADLGPLAERKQYETVARNIADQIRALEEA